MKRSSKGLWTSTVLGTQLVLGVVALGFIMPTSVHAINQEISIWSKLKLGTTALIVTSMIARHLYVSGRHNRINEVKKLYARAEYVHNFGVVNAHGQNVANVREQNYENIADDLIRHLRSSHNMKVLHPDGTEKTITNINIELLLKELGLHKCALMLRAQELKKINDDGAAANIPDEENFFPWLKRVVSTWLFTPNKNDAIETLPLVQKQITHTDRLIAAVETYRANFFRANEAYRKVVDILTQIEKAKNNEIGIGVLKADVKHLGTDFEQFGDSAVISKIQNIQTIVSSISWTIELGKNNVERDVMDLLTAVQNIILDNGGLSTKAKVNASTQTDPRMYDEFENRDSGDREQKRERGRDSQRPRQQRESSYGLLSSKW